MRPVDLLVYGLVLLLILSMTSHIWLGDALSGTRKRLSRGRKTRAFRQFPLHQTEEEGDDDFIID